MLLQENLKLKSSEMARNGLKLPKVKLIFDSYKTASNKLAFMFGQICMQVLKTEIRLNKKNDHIYDMQCTDIVVGFHFTIS